LKNGRSITDGLVRVSVGLETVKDIADLEQAFVRLQIGINDFRFVDLVLVYRFKKVIEQFRFQNQNSLNLNLISFF
jgi:hypothetical protein